MLRNKDRVPAPAARAKVATPQHGVGVPHDLETIPTAARIAKVHEITLRRWIKLGYVTLYGRPGSYRVSMAEVLPITAPRLLPGPPRKTGWTRTAEASSKANASRRGSTSTRNTDPS